MQDLVLPRHGGAGFDVAITLDGQRHMLSLHAHDLRTADFKLLVDDGTSIRQVPTPPSVTYRGAVVGHPDSRVAASLVNGQLEGAIHLDDVTWWVDPAQAALRHLPHRTHVVHQQADLVRGACGTDHSALPTMDRSSTPPTPPSRVVEEAVVAVDASFQAYQLVGSSVTNMQNTVTNTFNVVDQVYVRDVEITYLISTILVRTTSGLYTSSNPNVILSNFTSQWNNQHTGIPRDMAHLFMGRPATSTAGIANLRAVCDLSRAYGVTFWLGGLNGRADIACHELGHNWSAQHCDGASPCLTMCSGNPGCPFASLRFGTVSINSITNFKASRTCLSTPTMGQSPALATINPTSVTSFQPAQVDLTGSLLDSVESLTVGGVPVNFSIASPSSLSFVIPSPFDINTQPVVATNINGDSNTLNLDVLGAHPSVLEAPFLHPVTFPIDYRVYTDRNWIASLFLSTSLTPSAFPGTVSFGIGNNFSELFFLTNLFADNTGFAKINITMPPGAPSGLQIHWQAATWTPSGSLPFEVSNVGSTTIF